MSLLSKTNEHLHTQAAKFLNIYVKLR